MPNAGTTCARAAGHRGFHASREALRTQAARRRAA
jgi:hypothetical protein